MAIVGMGANVQCNGYFPGYYSARDLIFESEGSMWNSSNVIGELKNDCYQIGSLPLSSPCHLLGYNKELLKQTILKHEAIFRDQIHELHRIYWKQRELMDEIKRIELYKHNLKFEASWSSPSSSSKNVQKIFCSPNLPWLTGQSSVLIAESIQLPLGSVQEKSRQICSASAPAHAPIVSEGSLIDSKLSESKYRKVGKKILDLQLPADEYLDSEEGESLENERVTDMPQVSAYTLNRISQVVCNSDEKPYGANSKGFADLNLPFKLEEEAAAKSNDLGGPTHHMSNPFHDLSRITKLGSHNFPNDIIQSLNKGWDPEACSGDPLPDQENKHERLSSGQGGGVFDSFARVIDTEKQSIAVESLSKNLEQVNDPPCFRPLHQINQGPWTERKFSSGESSAGTQGPTSDGWLGPSSASRTCAPYPLVSGADMINSGISPVELWKTPVYDFGQSPIGFQAFPCFSTSASLSQSSKSLIGMSGFTPEELYLCKSVESDPNLDGQNFLLKSSFCSMSKPLDLQSVSTNDPNSCDERSSSASHELRKYVKGSEDVGPPNIINLNIMPAGYSETTALQSIQITGKENNFQDSRTGLCWLKEKPVPKGKPNEESKISTQIESVLLKPYNSGGTNALKLTKTEERDLSREKTLVFCINEKAHTSSDLHYFHTLKNWSKHQGIEETKKGCISDVNSVGNHVPDLEEQIPAVENLMKNEQKKHEPLVGIIDLNSCMNEDENMPMDVDFQAPASPENKECSPPRGESDENQLEMPFQLAEQGDPEAQEEQVRSAAEALVSISGFAAHNDMQMTNCSSSESLESNPLHWFAVIVSSSADHPENEVKVDFSGKTNDLGEFLHAEIDYFEFMTLRLTETKVLDCCCNSSGQTKQEGGSTPPTQPRKGRTSRGKWHKDFQSEILPSLASLSRYEVTEDLQTIGSLVEAAGAHSETGSLRSAGRNVLARGRRRSGATASNITDLPLKQQLVSDTELGIERRGLISWGKICRKRRGQRFPISNPQFIWSQVHN